MTTPTVTEKSIHLKMSCMQNSAVTCKFHDYNMTISYLLRNSTIQISTASLLLPALKYGLQLAQLSFPDYKTCQQIVSSTLLPLINDYQGRKSEWYADPRFLREFRAETGYYLL